VYSFKIGSKLNFFLKVQKTECWLNTFTLPWRSRCYLSPPFFFTAVKRAKVVLPKILLIKLTQRGYWRLQTAPQIECYLGKEQTKLSFFSCPHVDFCCSYLTLDKISFSLTKAKLTILTEKFNLQWFKSMATASRFGAHVYVQLNPNWPTRFLHAAQFPAVSRALTWT